MISPAACLAATVAVPLASAALLAVAGGRMGRAAGALGTMAAAAAFAFAVPVAALALLGRPVDAGPWTWIDAGGLRASIALRADALSAVMLLVVTGVGTLIHLYAVGYMEGDRGFGRFFSMLNLFLAFMLLLVEADDYLLLFVGWEGVGLCSYLLIGFEYERPAASAAGMKAFLVNRIGDVAFLLGVLLLWSAAGDVSVAALAREAPRLAATPVPLLGCSQATLAALLLLAGACGKSAQFPLHVWLPDAMEGPTPVSALIHAATMVTAGVYLVARSAPLFDVAPAAAEAVAAVGAGTALYAALTACAQDDLKRIWAYSTISQLGFMFVGVGLGARGAAIFHLVTHAFFKATLFLTAGAVMHALRGELNVLRMGGLRREMPWTSLALAFGAAALAGIPPFSGFFSKDAILAAAAHGHPVLFSVLLAAAFLTAFYAARAVALVALGEARAQRHAHEAPLSMLSAVLALAVLSLVGGALPAPALGDIEAHAAWVPWVAAAVAVAGAGIGLLLYARGPVRDPLEVLGAWRDRARAGFGVDAAADRLLVAPSLALWRLVRRTDEGGIDATAEGIGSAAAAVGDGLSVLQTGRLPNYLLYMAVGAAGILLALLGGVAL